MASVGVCRSPVSFNGIEGEVVAPEGNSMNLEGNLEISMKQHEGFFIS